MHDPGLLAIDVGSSCVKLGWFPPAAGCTSAPPRGGLPIAPPTLPPPQESFEALHRECSPDVWLDEVEQWLDGLPLETETLCALASVHLAAAGALEESLQLCGLRRVWRVRGSDLPVVARVAEPARVGIDRLVGALAVNQLRPAGRPAIAIDMGTATTVDLIAADGAFEGGAILAGSGLSLAALHRGTASLPRLEAGVMADAPPAVGKSTVEAMTSGAYWGAVGAVDELVRRIAAECPQRPSLFLTGGAAERFASHVHLDGQPARHLPHLVLSGLRLAAEVRLATS